MGNFARGRQVRTGRSIDFKQWSAIPGSTQDVGGSSTFVGPGLLSFAVPGTILRIRGMLRVIFAASGLTAIDAATVAFGLGLFATDAVTLGATAMPDPNAEPEFPWLWYGTALMRSASTDHGAPGASTLFEIDSKAMRKFKPGESLTMVGQYVNTAGNPTLHIDSAQIRVLIGT